jgi:hypothetical protein
LQSSPDKKTWVLEAVIGVTGSRRLSMAGRAVHAADVGDAAGRQRNATAGIQKPGGDRWRTEAHPTHANSPICCQPVGTVLAAGIRIL